MRRALNVRNEAPHCSIIWFLIFISTTSSCDSWGRQVSTDCFVASRSRLIGTDRFFVRRCWNNDVLRTRRTLLLNDDQHRRRFRERDGYHVSRYTTLTISKRANAAFEAVSLDRPTTTTVKTRKTTTLLKAASGFVDENSLRETLFDDMDDFEDDLRDRVLYWKRRENNVVVVAAAADGRSSSFRRRRRRNASRAVVAVDDDENLVDDVRSLDPVESTLIESLTESLRWYSTNGVNTVLRVPAKRTKRGRRGRTKRDVADDAAAAKNTNADTLRINCRSFVRPPPSSSPVVVVLTGWGDSHVRYGPLLRRLYEEGFTVHTLDHRGQGLSESSSSSSSRDGTANGRVTDVLDFDDYVEDYLEFHSRVVRPTLSTSSRPKAHLIAHSMGCLVALRAQGRASGELFDRLALVCPMFEPITPFPNRVTLWLARTATWLGLGKKGAKRNGGGGGEKKKKKKSGFRLSRKGVTHCLVRRSHWEMLRRRLPGIVALPSFRFLREVVGSSRRFVRGRRIPSCAMKAPMLVLTAGKDSYVDSNVTASVVQEMRRRTGSTNNTDFSVRQLHYADAYHDLLSEHSDVTGSSDPTEVIVSFLQQKTETLSRNSTSRTK